MVDFRGDFFSRILRLDIPTSTTAALLDGVTSIDEFECTAYKRVSLSFSARRRWIVEWRFLFFVFGG